MERFNLKRLSDVEVKKRYQVNISNKFAAFDDVDINRTWESIRENMEVVATENLSRLL
jgi:hypothetical protein